MEKKQEKKDNIQELDMNEDALKAIASKVSDGLTGAVEKQVSKMFEAKEQEAKEADKAEKAVKKNIAVDKKEVNEIKLVKSNDPSKEPVEKRFMKSVIALANGDRATLTKYNKIALAKATYANEGTNADGGYVIADPEFEAQVEKIQEQYGVAFKEADVRPINSNRVKTNKRGSNVTMYETSEAGSKTGTKLSIEQVERTLRKFAAIAPATDELVEDAAIDYWNEVVQGFAEERARLADQLVFTENGTTDSKKGILRADDTLTEPVGTTISEITWDDVLNAWSKIPTADRGNATLYLHPTVWNILRQTKDDDGRYQWVPQMGNATPFGLRVVEADIMPTSLTVDSDGSTPYAVICNLKRVKLYVKRGLVMTVLTEGTVNDTDGSSLNLALQDMTALRAVTRMVSLIKFPEAACVLGTGNVS